MSTIESMQNMVAELREEKADFFTCLLYRDAEGDLHYFVDTNIEEGTTSAQKVGALLDELMPQVDSVKDMPLIGHRTSACKD